MLRQVLGPSYEETAGLDVVAVADAAVDLFDAAVAAGAAVIMTYLQPRLYLVFEYALSETRVAFSSAPQDTALEYFSAC